MIVPMVRVRLAGPRSRLDETLRALQDFGALHLDQPSIPVAAIREHPPSRLHGHVERCLADVRVAFDGLRLDPHVGSSPASPPSLDGRTLRRVRRLRRQVEVIQQSAARLEDERLALERYREFFQAFETLIGHELSWPDRQAFYVILRADAGAALAELERVLEGEVEVLDAIIASGERAVLILASSRVAPRVSSLLAAARVDELPAPPGIADANLLRAAPAIKTRIEEIASQLRRIEQDRIALAASDGPWLQALCAFLSDEAVRLDAAERVFTAHYLFVAEGWVPSVREQQLRHQLQARLGADVEVEVVTTAATGGTPVALHNPPILRPFEIVTGLLPLPKYGTIDPTPFVAVFMPAFFGLMVGDVGYGLMLLALAAVLRWRAAPGSTLRSAAAVAAVCAVSTILFGVVFGEFFGSLGTAIGLHPVFHREQATLSFLALTLALGGVHIALGVLLGAVTAWRGGERRKAAGGGIALGMLVLTALLLFVAVRILPAALFTPLVVSILCAFVVLVALEGVVAVIELLSTFAHILSYARIMALGMASLMLAVVANEMVGALGSVLVGAVFALLFHLVNFAIAVLSPTIHALRLHYVEFFGHFFTPGGARYQPLAHWHPSP